MIRHSFTLQSEQICLKLKTCLIQLCCVFAGNRTHPVDTPRTHKFGTRIIHYYSEIGRIPLKTSFRDSPEGVTNVRVTAVTDSYLNCGWQLPFCIYSANF